MKLLVFGAMGKTGETVVEQALLAGHSVTAFMHTSIKTFSPIVKVIQGDASLRADVERAMEGQDAVIDVIGGRTPWRHTTLEQRAGEAIVSSMQTFGVSRLLASSMVGVGDSIRQCPVFVRVLVSTFLRGADKDKSAMESAIRSSGLDWTIVRPAVLVDAPARGTSVFCRNRTQEERRNSRAPTLLPFWSRN